MRSEPARHAAVMAGLVVVGLVGYRLASTLAGEHGQVTILVMLWTISTVGLNVIQGLGGYPSLAQASFYAGGAYLSAILLEHGHTAIVASLLAVLLTMFGGAVIGIVFARTRGQYFAIGTLFSCAVVSLVLVNEQSVTGGPQGKPVLLAFAPETTLRLLAGSVTVSLAVFYWLSRSRFGQRLRSIREDEDLAAHLGVPTARVKLLALVISSAFGAWAGVLLAQRDGLIAPSQFTFAKSFLMFVAIGLGGYGRLLTPLVGSILVVGVPELLDLEPGTSEIALGVLFIVITLVVPDGVIGGTQRLLSRLVHLRPRRSSVALDAAAVP
jgi:branched-chain amino acid transport system permease protein